MHWDHEHFVSGLHPGAVAGEATSLSNDVGVENESCTFNVILFSMFLGRCPKAGMESAVSAEAASHFV
jgi:hypothetical protein